MHYVRGVNETSYSELIEKDPVGASRLLVAKDKEILKLQQHLINARKEKFGVKSESLAVVTAQPSLFTLPELEEEEKPETISVPAHSRIKRARREIPAGTPVIRIEHPPTTTECTCCGSSLSQIREEITKILNYVPARFTLEEHARPVMVCRHCETPPVTTLLPAGIQLIEKSPVGVGLLSHIVISKYQDHLPLYRQEAMFARLGFEIPRQRMCDWLAHTAEILHPLYRVLKQELLLQQYLQADETTVKIQDGEVINKCHTGYFWAILAPPPVNLVYYHYAPSRVGEVPKALLDGYTGVLQTDLYAGYNTVYVPDGCIRAGCWTHVRRKFIEIQKLAGSNAGKTLQLIARLYQAETKDTSPERILAARQKYSVPALEKIHHHLTNWNARVLPSSDVKKALQYALKQWDALILFVTNPLIQLDNNLIENQMRPIAIGRKNWLFAGSHEGAMRAAIFFSFINSCRLNKINTWTYFNDVLPRIQSTPKEEMRSLLPTNWINRQ